MTNRSLIQFLAGCLIGSAGIGAAICLKRCAVTSDPAPAAQADAPEQAEGAAQAQQAPQTVGTKQVDPASTPAPTLVGPPGAPPHRVPKILYDKYARFEDGPKKKAAEEGEAEPKPTVRRADGSDWESRRSLFGLRPGDKIISINGQPVGEEGGPALLDRLSGERRLSIQVVRNGKPEVLTYKVVE
jgi:hypothetical protein